jgi:membrane protein YdbS with pleckstrin-like domain
MRPNDDAPTDLIPHAPLGGPPGVNAAPGPNAYPRTMPPGTMTLAVNAPAELSGMLLPTEHVCFASSPHPIVFLRPLVHLIVIAIALVVALTWETHPIVRGHHVTVPLITGVARTAVLIVAGLLALREVGSLFVRALRYFGFRIVSTNRRVFAVQGIFGRTVRPIGNSALAGATMSQGPLGRMLGYGNVVLSGASGLGSMREMRDPVRLYRECEAVAQGVDGDQWTPAVRQTIIP